MYCTLLELNRLWTFYRVHDIKVHILAIWDHLSRVAHKPCRGEAGDPRFGSLISQYPSDLFTMASEAKLHSLLRHTPVSVGLTFWER